MERFSSSNNDKISLLIEWLSVHSSTEIAHSISGYIEQGCIYRHVISQWKNALSFRRSAWLKQNGSLYCSWWRRRGNTLSTFVSIRWYLSLSCLENWFATPSQIEIPKIQLDIAVLQHGRSFSPSSEFPLTNLNTLEIEVETDWFVHLDNSFTSDIQWLRRIHGWRNRTVWENDPWTSSLIHSRLTFCSSHISYNLRVNNISRGIGMPEPTPIPLLGEIFNIIRQVNRIFVRAFNRRQLSLGFL